MIGKQVLKILNDNYGWHSIVGVVLELKHIKETNLIRVSYVVLYVTLLLLYIIYLYHLNEFLVTQLLKL